MDYIVDCGPIGSLSTSWLETPTTGLCSAAAGDTCVRVPMEQIDQLQYPGLYLGPKPHINLNSLLTCNLKARNRSRSLGFPGLIQFKKTTVSFSG